MTDKSDQTPHASLHAQRNDAFLQSGNLDYIDALFRIYNENPEQLAQEWREFFRSFPRGENVNGKTKPSWNKDLPKLNGVFESEHHVVANKTTEDNNKTTQYSTEERRQATRDSVRALMMIRAFRIRGHLAANLDPLQLRPKTNHPELNPETYGFKKSDMNREIFIDNVLGLENATVNQMIDILKRTYCSTLGVEFMHISDPEEKAWIQQRIEGPDKEIFFTQRGKKAILTRLIQAEMFEHFLNAKYTGTKRFGLDGGEAVIPALEQVIKHGGANGIKEIVIGMPHRGRLNVLANVMGKPLRAIFNEFKGGSSTPHEVEGSGDVKYHLGTSTDRKFDDINVHLSLTANPSHLEIVDPVVLGKVRAKQDQIGDHQRNQVLPLILHGDAAFAGQGVVAECFGLSALKGHKSGGSIHFIINNQIGFTTSPIYARSSPYPSDVAKTIGAPILHVNGDDPEAVTYAAKIAVEFRQKFAKPVIIDMFCYRRFGHNEIDEPSFTQPIMYKRIHQQPSVVKIYAQKLIENNITDDNEIEAIKQDIRHNMEDEFNNAETYKPNKADWLDGRWTGLRQATQEGARKGQTGVALKTLKQVGEKTCVVPENFTIHKTLNRLIAARKSMISGEKPIDWAMAEHLALGTLLAEEHHVRFVGQDSERGTFSQRHAALIDQNNEEKYTALSHISERQGHFEIINSMLSEMAVLGFEYGYSLAEPNTLVLWEAQFGDFANGAQVVIDQFIASGERKWLRMSGLVLLLPHGYEGQGPEHSSARPERFLQMCAEDNMQIANCTTPANYFHILRRQLKRNFRKPLIILTPKALLRHKYAVSKLEEFSPKTSFHRVLWDDAESRRRDRVNGQGDRKMTLVKPDKIRRVILCSGKVYYDLYEKRQQRAIDDIYIMRIEQLYPFPAKALVKELKRFPNAEIIWCQEEPYNMGAWYYIARNIEWVLERVVTRSTKLAYVGRPAAASPASGSLKQHNQELQKFINEALK